MFEEIWKKLAHIASQQKFRAGDEIFRQLIMSGNKILCSVVGLCIYSLTIFGQSPNTVVGAGYTPPVPIKVAPGQAVTLFLQGIGGDLPQPVRADRLPLPTTLAGISVSLHQTSGPQAGLPVPLFSVERYDFCRPASTLCGPLTLVTVQIPFDLFVRVPGMGIPPIDASLIVSENGVAKGTVPLIPVTDNIHVLRSCETASSFTTPGCGDPLVTHADGSLVTSSNPAKSGEVLVMYAFGLGGTIPRVKAGDPAPTPAPIAQSLIGFDFSPNAPPMHPRPRPPMGIPIPPPSPLFVGLTPGVAGLYQINFRVPEVPRLIARCDSSLVRSNLTVSIGGAFSFDGAGICVVVPD